MKVNYREALARLSKEELLDYAEMMAKNFWNLQNNWMLNITQRFGSDVAAEFDALVFGRNAEVQGWRLKKLFNLGGSIADLVKALNYSMILVNVEFEYPEISEKRCRVRVTRCTMQLERLRLGLPELPCKPAGVAANTRFTAAINPKISTTCILCPPDEHPEDNWCEWQFALED